MASALPTSPSVLVAVLAALATTTTAVRLGAQSLPHGQTQPSIAAPDIELEDEAELERVVNLYYAGRYADCAKELGRLLDPKSPRALDEPDVVESARVWLATCLLGSGQPRAAEKPLEDAIRANPTMRPPDGLVFPDPVIQLFLAVRQRLQTLIDEEQRRKAQAAADTARLERERLRDQERRLELLRELAETESVVQTNSRWMAAVPFGVGQFQNRNEPLGWLFLASETILLGTLVTAISVQSHLTAQIYEANPAELQARQRDWQLAIEISSWGLLGVAALGVAEAQLRFEPEFRTSRRRALPPEVADPSAAAEPEAPKKTALRVVPTITASDTSVGVGLVGTF